jgi:membrane-associated phospholipid phosphatase
LSGRRSLSLPRAPILMRGRALGLGGLLAVGLAARGSAAAETTEDFAPSAFDAGAVDWHPEFRHVGVPEYIAGPLLLLGTAAQGLLVKPETEADWTGPILMDRPLRNWLRADSAAGRSRANRWSNILLGASALQLALIDPWLVAGWIHRRPDVAWQLTVIDAEAFGLTELANQITKRLVSRERPYGEECNGKIGPSCASSGRYLSFFSGHATASSTFAGLTCAHHRALALYGSFAADLGACLGSIGVTVATGFLRVASDKHWWSDVLVGHAVGFSAGYLLTWALYYHEPAPVQGEGLRTTVLPILGSGVWGLAWGGRL